MRCDPPSAAEETDWENLVRLLPEAKALHTEGEHRRLAGYVRRRLIQDRDENAWSQNCFQVTDVEAIRALVRSLPNDSPAEITAALAEWHLSGEAAAVESANWPFRHQSASGELLLDETLVVFRLVRLQEFAFVLLSMSNDERIPAGFTAAFGKGPDVSSHAAVKTADRVWAAWAWFLDPDPVQARLDAERLSELWGELERAL